MVARRLKERAVNPDLPGFFGPRIIGERRPLRGLASIGAVGGTIQNLALYLSIDRQFAQVDIDTTLSAILLGSIVGRLTMGWLADRWAKKHVMILIYVIVALSIPLLVYAPTPTTTKLCAFLFGIGLGGDYMIIPLLARLSGSRTRSGTSQRHIGLKGTRVPVGGLSENLEEGASVDTF